MRLLRARVARSGNDLFCLRSCSKQHQLSRYQSLLWYWAPKPMHTWPRALDHTLRRAPLLAHAARPAFEPLSTLKQSVLL